MPNFISELARHVRAVLYPLVTAAILVVTCHPSGVSAMVFVGSFAGKAANSTWAGMIDGTAITGTFHFDSAFAYALADTDGSSFVHYSAFNMDANADPIHMSFAEADGANFEVNGFGVLDIWLRNTPDGQAVSFSSYFVHGVGATVSLAGGAGCLFDDLNIDSLHLSKPSATGSFGHMAFHGGIENDVLFDSLVLDAPSSVSEPATALLVCLGCAGLAVTRRRH